MNFGFTRKLRNLGWLRRRRSAHLLLGWRGERAAVRHVVRSGYRVIARNYRGLAGGEVDLICSKGACLVFIEVKTRSGDGGMDPRGAVAHAQWQRIERAAHQFMAHPAAANRPCRFDLVLVAWPERGRPHIEHIEDAYHVLSY